MIKIRIEGLQKEITPLVGRWIDVGLPTVDLCKTYKVKSVSKFYDDVSVGSPECYDVYGRLYIDVEPF